MTRESPKTASIEPTMATLMSALSAMSGRWASARSRAQFALLLRRSRRWRTHPTIVTARRISMLHEDTLAMLHLLARRCKGAVVEIGPYMGGSTIAIASGLRPGAPFVSIELGGAHDHPDLPTKDIVGDLQNNLRNAGVADKVSIVVGHSNTAAVRNQIVAQLRGRKIGLLVIDSDGEIDHEFTFYRPLMRRNCTLVFDDYEMMVRGDVKDGMVKAWIETAERAGKVRSLGVLPWSTWIGRPR